MKATSQQIIKIGISGIVFDSLTPKKILLIKREKQPYTDLWSFPGGRLEFNERIEDGIKREVKEETGYNVDLINQQYNINQVIHPLNHYIIMSCACVIKDYSKDHEQIHSQFFYLDQYLGTNPNEKYNLSSIQSHQSIPNLQNIIATILQTSFNLTPLQNISQQQQKQQL